MPKEKKVLALHSSFFVQLSIILFYFSFFYDAALFFRGFINLTPVIGILIAALLNGGLILCLAEAVILFRREKKDCISGKVQKKSFLHGVLIPRIPLLVVVLTFTFLALMQFDSLPRYDAGLYYSPLITATRTFTFDFQSLLHSFSLSTHPTQGFAFLIGAGEMLFPMKVVGVYLVSLALTIVALFCLYDLIPSILPETHAVPRSLCLALFAFNPYVLGLFSYTTPDYYLSMFFIILVWAYKKNWHILGMFMGLLVCFSKEPGILFVASFLVTAFLVRIVQIPGKGFFNKAITYMWPKNILLYGSVPALFILYFKTLGDFSFASTVTNASPLRWDSEGIHCFGINMNYIKPRLTQLLVYNFFWIALILCFVASLIIVFRAYKRTAALRDSGKSIYEHNESSCDLSIVAGIAVSTLVYIVFSCLFITHLCPRYAVCMAFPIALVILWAFQTISKNRKIVITTLAVIAALFMGQCYYELDPTIIISCNGLDLGSQTIYSPTTAFYSRISYLDVVGEYYVHNRMYTYADDLTVKALEKMDIKEDDVIVYVFLEYMEIYLSGDPLQTDNLIYWDPATHRRTYENNIEGAFVPRYKILGSDPLEGDAKLSLPDEFYLMTTNHPPFEYLDDFERRGFEITDSFTVENQIGLLNVYTLKKTAG